MKADPRVSGWAFNKFQEIPILVTSLMIVVAVIGVLVVPSPLILILLFISIGIWVVIIQFFRDPARDIHCQSNQVLSPADGVIKDITTVLEQDYYQEPRIRVGIFLSLFNVHVQRAPLSGRVAFVNHQSGKYLPAYEPASSYENAQITLGIDSEFGLIIIKQISGILARKCVNYSNTGDQIQAGQRYGLIKFGSRVEIFLPASTELLCTVGDKVYGGLTILANVPEKDL
ncbi:MAG: phosphatidylserine decarboxylase [Anaerolineales bacterium]